MTVTTTSLGTNMSKISYSAGESLPNVISAVDTFLIGRGWALYDGSVGTNVDVYRAVCKDGSTYKYLYLDWSTGGYLIVRCYEEWDNGPSHSGTNPAYKANVTPNTAAAEPDYDQQIDLTNGGDIYISASARWVVIVTYQNSTWGDTTWNGCQGIVECQVVASDSAPPFFYFNSGNMAYESATNPWYAISFPRITKASATGQTAAQYTGWSAPHCGAGFMGTYQYSHRIAGRVPYTTDGTHTDPRSGNALGSGICVNGYFCNEFKGFAYGLMFVAAGLGSWNDTPQIKVDSDYLYDSTGTLTDFFMLQGGTTGLLRLAIPR